MAILTSAIFPILTSIIGSGFTLFIINSIVADINQPHIFVHVQELPLAKISNGVNSNYNSDTTRTFKVVASNDGRTSATNIRLTVYYPQSTIFNYTTPFYSDNTTLTLEKPSLLVAQTKRLAMGSVIIVNTAVVPNRVIAATGTLSTAAGAATVSKAIASDYDYIVSASYDQGSVIISNTFSPVLVADDTNAIPQREQLLIIFALVSAFFFIVALLYKRLGRFKTKLNRPKYFSQIAKEISEVRNVLSNNILSKQIFDTSIWDSRDDNYKHRTFVDYIDYYLIDKFYNKLKESRLTYVS